MRNKPQYQVQDINKPASRFDHYRKQYKILTNVAATLETTKTGSEV